MKENSVCQLNCCLRCQCLQFLYDKGKQFQDWREWMAPFLGHWHIFKHLTMRVWQVYARVIWGPLWHKLFPKQKFRLHPKLKTASTFLSYVRLAYSSVSDEFKAAILSPAIVEEQKAHLKKIHLLCTYVIPKVLETRPHNTTLTAVTSTRKRMLPGENGKQMVIYILLKKKK